MDINFEQIKKESSIKKIDDRITRFTLGPNNWCCYLIEDRKNVLIDASYPIIKPFVDKKIDILVITHPHFDHISFAKEIIEINNPKVYASKEANEWLEGNKDEIIPSELDYEPLKRWKTPPIVYPVKITDFVKEGDVINTGSLYLKVLETPGHSPGEICLYEEKQKILFSGDIWFGGDVIGKWTFRGGNKQLLEKSIKRLKSLETNKLCPGHLIY